MESTLSLSPIQIRTIIETLQGSDWNQAAVIVGDVQISVARNGVTLPGSRLPSATLATPAAFPVTVLAESSSPAKVPAIGKPSRAAHVVESPSVGVFWSSPIPGAEPFVTVGSRVKAGDALCTIQIMKLMDKVTAGVSGEVVAVHATNANAIEYGTPLFTIRLEE